MSKHVCMASWEYYFLVLAILRQFQGFFLSSMSKQVCMVSWELSFLLTNCESMVSSHLACQNRYAWFIESILTAFWVLKTCLRPFFPNVMFPYPLKGFLSSSMSKQVCMLSWELSFLLKLVFTNLAWDSCLRAWFKKCLNW